MLKLRFLLPAAAVVLLTLGSCSQKAQTEAQAEAADSAAVAQEEALTGPAEKADVVIELAEGQALDLTSGKPVVIDFNATWCGPCRSFAPVFHEVAGQFNGKALFYSVDVDKHPDLAAQYNTTAIPMVVYISADGSDVSSQVGLQSKEEFTASVEKLLK